MILYDRILLWLILCLFCIGFVIVSSASMSIGMKLFCDPFYFIKHNLFYVVLILFLSIGILQIPIKIWNSYSTIILIFTLIMLSIVLIIGDSINGSSRWIILGLLHIQPSELSKLALFL